MTADGLDEPLPAPTLRSSETGAVVSDFDAVPSDSLFWFALFELPQPKKQKSIFVIYFKINRAVQYEKI